jgi:hypothetical protein
VSRFESAHPHTSSTAARIKVAPVDAAESIVFDAAGNYYVGGEGPAPQTALDPVQPYGYIVKFSSRNTWLATYEVPNGRSGANWIDLGSDGQTVYYTSEDETIHVYRPGRSRGAADDPIHRYVPGEDFYREIPIMQGSVHVQGTVYGVRLLPPAPGDTTLQPSGFLVAQYWRVLRLDSEGQIVQQYADDAPGSYLSVSVTPDGRSFWTAKVGGGACAESGGSSGPKSSRDDCGTTNGPGTLLKFDIATGDLTSGPIQTGTDNVWGLCAKREYTAALNTCYALDFNGTSLRDASGPMRIPCLPPPTCGPESAGDPSCAPRPPVLSNPGMVTMYVGEASAMTFDVAAPSHNFYQVTTTGLPGGVQAPAEVGPALHYSFDLRGTPATAGTYPSQICMSNPLLPAPVCQAFTVKVLQPRLASRGRRGRQPVRA